MSGRIVLAGAVTALALALVPAGGQAAAEGWSVSKFLGGKEVQGSGKVITQERDVPAFDRIESKGPLDVSVRIGSPQKLALTIDDNLADLVSTEVEGKTLKIEITRPCRSESASRLEITVPELAGFSGKGSGDITLADLDGEAFEYEGLGSGDLHASGKIGSLDVSIMGSGDVQAQDLQADAVKVSIMGSGDAVVRAGGSLDASIMGSGDVTCYGKPAHVQRHVMGSGEISLK